jgi:Rrf2 family protein
VRITYKGDYALKAVLVLTQHYGEGVVTVQELAKQVDAPIKFLEQVLLDLKRGDFVESRRGKVGGYLLAKPPIQIRLGDVIRFIDGPIEPISCLEHDYPGCSDLSNCIFRAQIVDNITFEDLTAKLKKKQIVLSYSI